MAQAGPSGRLPKQLGAVGRAVVDRGAPVLHPDGCTRAGLVGVSRRRPQAQARQPFDLGPARGVFDGHTWVVPTVSMVTALAGADADDAAADVARPQVLDVEVDRLARSGLLVADHGGRGCSASSRPMSNRRSTSPSWSATCRAPRRSADRSSAVAATFQTYAIRPDDVLPKKPHWARPNAADRDILSLSRRQLLSVQARSASRPIALSRPVVKAPVSTPMR